MMHRCDCPHCGKTLRYGHGNPLQAIGTPVQECDGCHRKYLDNNMYEWALLPWYLKIHLLLFANCKWFIHVMAIALAYALENSAWCFLIFGVFEIMLCSLLIFLMLFFNDTEIKRSHERSQNPSYVRLLVNAGYDKLRHDVVSNYDVSQNAEHTPIKNRQEEISGTRNRKVEDTKARSRKIVSMLWQEAQSFAHFTRGSALFYDVVYFWSILYFEFFSDFAIHHISANVEYEFGSYMRSMQDHYKLNADDIDNAYSLMLSIVSTCESMRPTMDRKHFVNSVLESSNLTNTLHNPPVLTNYIPCDDDIFQYEQIIVRIKSYLPSLLDK